jgi:hypothetical protein
MAALAAIAAGLIVPGFGHVELRLPEQLDAFGMIRLKVLEVDVGDTPGEPDAPQMPAVFCPSCRNSTPAWRELAGVERRVHTSRREPGGRNGRRSSGA